MLKSISAVCGLLAALVPGSVQAEALPAAGTQVTYKGSVAPLTEYRSVGAPGKTFELVLVFDDVSDSGAKIYWHLEESGSGRWPWAERFGMWSADAQGNISGLAPSLLYDRGEGTSVIILAAPLLATEETLEPEANWSDGKFNFLVQKKTTIAEQPTWQIEASNNYGWQRVFWRGDDSPLARQYRQRVFMGMGEEYRLEMQAEQVKQLSQDELKAVSQSFEALLALRAKLNRPSRKEDPTLNEKQLALLSEELPGLRQLVSTGSLVKVVNSARGDLEEQSDRSSAVDKLAAQQVGQKTPEFSLEGLGTAKLKNDDLAGNVTVLHFWEYKDTPLKEPYGQVGYLDFLYQKRNKEGLQVYGIAVDRAISDPNGKSQVLRSVRKLASFMNLDYPILLDDGKVLARLGDPQALGAPLPLFVVIGRDGKIAHYHVGHYEVDRNAGLKELDEVVTEALKAKE